MNFSRNIRILRGAKEWSLRELSQKSGVSAPTIKRLETHPFESIENPSVRTIENLAKGFGLPRASQMLIDESWVKPWLTAGESLKEGEQRAFVKHVQEVMGEVANFPKDERATACVVAAQGAPLRVAKAMANTAWGHK